ncbi:MAG TPA: pyridoxamine 5'-phosphate oxidase family protein [Solirubrobacterales bacterium]|nr:pyridoxamine 5'-phosphate oxidase family protein [Solirubrobacterales bacterium]
MTSSLPPEVRDVFERFITTEYTTVDSRQQPITWPVTPYYRSGEPTIDVTTGLGYPKKADDAQRNRYVSLLFSDPTGSGIEGGCRVLVQGTAQVDDRDLDANRERYWRESGEKLPATKEMHPPKLLRGMFGWYYTRIYVNVRPERVFVWPEGDHSTPPTVHDARLEEVRSGHTEEPPAEHEPPQGGAPKWDERINELGRRYETAVLAWVGPDGFPISIRVPVRLDQRAGRIAVGSTPAGLPIAEGRACLTAHSHGPRFEWQENFQVRGDLVRDGDGWAVVPRRAIGGFELPDESTMARYRRNLTKSIRFYRTARGRLKQRD